MPSGSRLILHDCDIYYLSAVNYDPKRNRSNFHQGQYLLRSRGGGHLHVANFSTCLCFPGHYLLMGLTVQYLLAEVIIYPGGQGEEAYCRFSFLINFFRATIYPVALLHNFYRGHYLSWKIYCLVLDCIKAIIHIRPLSFIHGIANM